RGTEKDSPCACPKLWYGSCPRMTTLTRSNGVWLNALKISLLGGKTVYCCNSACKKVLSAFIYGFSNSGSNTVFQLLSNCMLMVSDEGKLFFALPSGLPRIYIFYKNVPQTSCVSA